MGFTAGKEWCWTETYKSIVPKKNEVGTNWGFCKSKKEISSMTFDYELTVIVPDVEHSSGGDGPY
jgi:hypothetical protein